MPQKKNVIKQDAKQMSPKIKNEFLPAKTNYEDRAKSIQKIIGYDPSKYSKITPYSKQIEAKSKAYGDSVSKFNAKRETVRDSLSNQRSQTMPRFTPIKETNAKETEYNKKANEKSKLKSMKG